MSEGMDAAIPHEYRSCCHNHISTIDRIERAHAAMWTYNRSINARWSCHISAKGSVGLFAVVFTFSSKLMYHYNT